MKSISVVVRFHKGANFEYLKDSLFSLAVQDFVNVQVVLMMQNCSTDQVQSAENFLIALPFLKSRRVLKIDQKFKGKINQNTHIICNLKSKKDIRAKLLDVGLKLSTCRYFAILDYDDIVYQHCYSFLIDKLENSNSVIAIGGCKKVGLSVKNLKVPFISSKVPFLNRKITIADQFVENFIPIHSFVIDKKRIKKQDLFFNTKLGALEDYDFLLRIQSQYLSEFSGMSNFVCEYRIRDDNSQTTPFHDMHNVAKYKNWMDARKHIAQLKKNLKLNFSVDQIAQILVQ